jgi:putative ABC transport system ATP-binding protein
MLSFQKISKTFHPNSPQEVQALVNLDLQINEGDYAVIIGSNGSGKSTLLNIAAGAYRPDTGHILINQDNITHLPDYQRSKWIARIFQNPLSGTAPDLSVLDNFRLASLRTQHKTLRIGINQAFRKKVQEKTALLGMGLENKLDQAVGTLSGGQRQALTLIMAIMDEAKILLMDEPTAALDPKSAQTLMQKAQEIIKEFGLTAILVTHDLKDAQQYGNRLIQMQGGQILRTIPPNEKTSLQLPEIFQWFA